ncbi:hypothetical protein ACA910_017471 [Epithemia clementina (nom. ined.)]
MGRITIFTADGCVHSRRVQAAFRQRRIPFVEISVSRYPDKQADMIALTNQEKRSTPQVFFNTRHVGGADETLALLQQWDQDSRYASAYDRFRDEIEQHWDPVNPRFQIPQEEQDAVPIKSAGPPRGESEYSIVLPPWSSSKVNKTTVLAMTELLKEILPSQDTAKRWTIHRMSFTGEQATQALMEHYKITSCDALQLFQHLVQQQVIIPEDDNEAESAADNSTTNKNNNNKTTLKQVPCSLSSPQALYRLQCYAQPSVLNSYRVWNEPSVATVDFMQLLYHLNDILTRILMQMTNDDGSIDYLAARAHPLYPIFEEAVCAIQKVNLGGMNDTTKTAFGINLYNIMIKYAFIKVGAGTSDYSRLLFFNNVSFNVGGHIYNFQDWENGILRGNRKAPYALSLQFKNAKSANGANNSNSHANPRLQFIVQKPDCRIHFALNCGARSCPPVSFYTAENLSHELSLAAAAFCEEDAHVYISPPPLSSSTTIIPELRQIEGKEPQQQHASSSHRLEIRLNKIFAWYKIDFVPHAREYPERLLQFLHGVKKQQMERLMDAAKAKKALIKVTFAPYDWSTANAKQIAAFNPRALKSKERRSLVQSIFGVKPVSPRNNNTRKKVCSESIAPRDTMASIPSLVPTTATNQRDHNDHQDDDDDDNNNVQGQLNESIVSIYSEYSCSASSSSDSPFGGYPPSPQPPEPKLNHVQTRLCL